MDIPDFIETNRPRHEPLEAMKRLANPSDRFDARDYVAAISPRLGDAPPKPQTLLEMYDSLHHIAQDARARPKHYSDRQHEIIEHLTAGAPAPEPTTAEKNELMLTFTRSTESEASRKDLISRASQKLTADQELDALLSGSSFENQNYDDGIVII